MFPDAPQGLASYVSVVVFLSSAQAEELAAVALGGLGFGDGFELRHGFARVGGFEAEFAAKVGFAVEGLGDGRGAADFAEEQDLDLEVAAFVADL